MIEEFIASIVREEIKKLSLRDKMTGFLVKKKRRGTHQAFEESALEEQKIVECIDTYIKNWFQMELTGGVIRASLTKEVLEQVKLELFSRGFVKIL